MTGKLATFFDNAIVKIIGAGVVTTVFIGLYLNYKVQIDTISEKVDNVTKVQHIE